MNILIVDDQSTMRSLIRGMLGKMGFTSLEEAEDGDVALNKMKQGAYDLVISDVHMPRLNGLEFLKQARSIETLRHVPFLMVTTESSKSAVLEAIKLKVNGYIVKPFTPETLQDKLSRMGISPPQGPAGDAPEETQRSREEPA
ncbi:MAG: response regulator [Deltaproteobacteria bacterium]|nr:response regulator [Deltaproteobacteria bacterium]